MSEEKIPSWYRSRYRGYKDFDTDKFVVTHDKPLRCPYCGKEMGFATPIFYEYHTSDWYWYCTECNLQIGNVSEVSEKDLDKMRRAYRERLGRDMQESKMRYESLKNLYNAYGKYFTPEEKRDRLIETIEEHKPTESIE